MKPLHYLQDSFKMNNITICKNLKYKGNYIYKMSNEELVELYNYAKNNKNILKSTLQKIENIMIYKGVKI